MGEVFRESPAYVGDYQKHMDSVFDYPLNYVVKRVFGEKNSMRDLVNYMKEEKKYYRDVDALGTFVDNHDNERYLHRFPGQEKTFHASLLFSMSIRGIPFVYYGSEQDFNGGDDPENRETMWSHFSEDTDIYRQISKVNMVRSIHGTYNHPMVEKYVNDDVYVFSRNDVVFAFTNRDTK